MSLPSAVSASLKTDETDNYHRVERSYGAFTRSFTLPQTVSAEGATAEYNNGVLRVTLPKREETKARRIQVSGTNAGAQEDNRHDRRNRQSERSQWRALKAFGDR